jgi:antirestriction protein ArdC
MNYLLSLVTAVEKAGLAAYLQDIREWDQRQSAYPAKKGKGKKVHEIITETIINKIQESGELPWQKPWRITDTQIMSYHGHTYRGINLILSLLAERKGPWITWNQIKKLGGRVKDGEQKKYEIVTFFKINKYEDKDSGDEKTYPMMRFYKVYSLCQTENVPIPKWLEKRRAQEGDKKEITPIEAGQQVWENYPDKPDLNHGGSRACYSPKEDKISMPDMQDFTSSEEYYCTLFHEMAHSTGHSKCLDRLEPGTVFADLSEYSKEELVAELGASFLMAETGIEAEHTKKNNVAYIKNWLTKLDSDPKFIIQASSQAQKAVDHIKGVKWEKKEDD